MADKSFGVKELNLLNASGTPTITSPNNLNLNANTVAISTSVTIGHNLTVSANAGIASLNVTGIATVNNFIVAGVTTTSDDIKINADNKKLLIGASQDLYLWHNGSTGNSNISNVTGDLFIQGHNGSGTAVNQIAIKANAAVELNYQGNKKLETTTNGIDVTGAITVNGSATSAWTVGHNGASNYVISGPGGLSNANNPDLYLVRGQTYQFIMNASGHGFGIQTSSGTWNSSNAYTTGITNAGAATGTITFQVPYSAPPRLYYACTSQHSGMVGNIYIRGAGGNNTNVGLTTFSGLIHLKSGVPAIFLEDTDGTHGQGIIEQNGDDLKIRQDAGNASSGTGSNIRFEIDASEKMRLHSSGALSVGTSPSATYWSGATAAFFESVVQNTVTISHSGGGNNYPLTVRNNRVNSSTEGYMITFLGSSAVLQGSIRSINGSTSYNSGSDYRLKENIVDISDGITRVKQLQPRRFNWISDSNKTVQDGFIAHELQSVVPESTTGTKDEIVNQEGINNGSYHPDAKVGDAVYQSVDYGKMTPLLTAALKELITKVETLEAKVSALEGS